MTWLHLDSNIKPAGCRRCILGSSTLVFVWEGVPACGSDFFFLYKEIYYGCTDEYFYYFNLITNILYLYPRENFGKKKKKKKKVAAKKTHIWRQCSILYISSYVIIFILCTRVWKIQGLLIHFNALCVEVDQRWVSLLWYESKDMDLSHS